MEGALAFLEFEVVLVIAVIAMVVLMYLFYVRYPYNKDVDTS